MVTLAVLVLAVAALAAAGIVLVVRPAWEAAGSQRWGWFWAILLLSPLGGAAWYFTDRRRASTESG